ncbi:MAG TPA: YitT family protein [Candidatus Limadaptatus stercorigallinarum]|uniref:YitT family protein n=1 Tax=Candidatus Limadaptatus stercorigallinarum TaxID=2840845 RepID=A0A9D1HRU2_9FIRM|nr:YitT family protein [Christensenellales bacterium]HIU21496.1 YitT family protein [Candidatus Limadaptatus stercorigallinarum]
MAKFRKPTPKQVLHVSRFYLFLTILAFIRALSAYVFIVPNGFAPSGITGLSSLLYNMVTRLSDSATVVAIFDPSITAFVLNIPLFIAAFVVLDRKFAFNTFFTVTVYSVFMAVFSIVEFPQYTAGDPESGYNLLASLAGGALAGISLGFMLRYNTSLGGTDVIGKLIYAKNPVADVQWLIFMCDCIIVIAAGGLGVIDIVQGNVTDTNVILTLVLSPMIYSFISQLTTSQVADVLQSGFQSSLVFNIISDKHNEIAEHITSEMHRGVTIMDGIGYYTGEEHKVLVCVVRRKQINTVKRIVQECDPAAFTFITKAREVKGNGFAPPADAQY